jgi:hypothetical protein
VREREIERMGEQKRTPAVVCVVMCVRVCVCVRACLCVRERQTERERWGGGGEEKEREGRERRESERRYCWLGSSLYVGLRYLRSVEVISLYLEAGARRRGQVGPASETGSQIKTTTRPIHAPSHK